MNWKFLHNKLHTDRSIKGISMEYEQFNEKLNQPVYSVKETTGKYRFEMLRLPVSRRKITVHDDLGLVGLNSLDLSIDHCYLTEGVSDFMSKKLMQEGTSTPNVLGVVTLGGCKTARVLLKALFNNYTIVADNDPTGLKELRVFRQWLVAQGKTVHMQIPEPGFKDISAQFMNQR